MAKISDIKFTVENPPHLRHVDQNVTVKHKGGLEMVHFKLGMGPCGRHVTDLETRIDTSTIRIKQASVPPEVAELYDQVEAIRARLHGSIRGGRMYRNATVDLLAVLEKIPKDAVKVETFTYQLEDVRGRIKAVHVEGDLKPTQ